MTLPQVQELLDYWRAHPPLHLLVAAALGVTEKRSAEDFAALAALAPNGILAGKGRD
ncbi:MAG TPA: hypothetical protein VN766_17465 [Stellaceae bacterium]|jgi:hypothetical protein|nr:hypothetical protein [Stellaceae bacterium]